MRKNPAVLALALSSPTTQGLGSVCCEGPAEMLRTSHKGCLDTMGCFDAIKGEARHFRGVSGTLRVEASKRRASSSARPSSSRSREFF